MSAHPTTEVVCDSCRGTLDCPICEGRCFLATGDSQLLSATQLCGTCAGSGKCPDCFDRILQAAFGPPKRVNGD